MPQRAGRVIAIGVTALAATLFLVRVPAAIRYFDERAAANARLTPAGRTIQAADGLDISNDFLVQALRLLPHEAPYVLRLPARNVAPTYGISPTTYQALPGYVQFLLLPRRAVGPERARYLLCYACDTSPFDARMQRLWSTPDGYVIGRLRP
jgi:hypothetical protein